MPASSFLMRPTATGRVWPGLPLKSGWSGWPSYHGMPSQLDGVATRAARLWNSLQMFWASSFWKRCSPRWFGQSP